MKRSELTQLTQIIEHLVTRELKKQLPAMISEVIQNLDGKSHITETVHPINSDGKTVVPKEIPESIPSTNFKASLRELFAGTPVINNAPEQPTRQFKQFTKDPMLNQILNETVPDLRARERFTGAAAFQGGYSPSLTMVPGFTPPGQDSNIMAETPQMASTRPPVQLVEGQESNHAPMETLPTGMSVLDMKHHAPAAVKGALTRNYSEMMKLIDKKKKGIT